MLRTERDLVTVVGADARRYLHGQLSADVDAIEVGQSRWTLVLAPNGRIVSLARIHRAAETAFEFAIDAGYGADLAARLQRFKIRVDVDIDVAGARTVVTDDDGPLVGWWGDGTWRVDPDTSADADDQAAHDHARTTAGWPAMGSEIVPGETIPAETGIVNWAASLTKGCYPGQELVERMDSRGATAPRRLRRFCWDPGTAPTIAPGDPVVDEQGDEVGVYTSVAGDVALGYVKRGSAAGVEPGPPTAD
ncbi:hypothetical protein BH24ACT5_BH24ACT5_22150 [soil metagenome]